MNRQSTKLGILGDILRDTMSTSTAALDDVLMIVFWKLAAEIEFPIIPLLVGHSTNILAEWLHTQYAQEMSTSTPNT